MKCHICHQEMRVTGTEVLQDNETVQTTVETWRCDRCDTISARLGRAFQSFVLRVPIIARYALVAGVFLVCVALPFIAYLLFAMTARIP
jgi:hypothetical protein